MLYTYITYKLLYYNSDYVMKTNKYYKYIIIIYINS